MRAMRNFTRALLPHLFVLSVLCGHSLAQEAIPCGPGQCCGTVISSCRNCTRGTYSDGTMANCAPCPAGSFADSYGSPSCEPCAPGSFSAAGGAPLCDLCPVGTFRATPNGTRCTGCPTGKTTLAPGRVSESECVCADGTVAAGTGCGACPENAACVGGVARPAEGYWSSSADPTAIQRCAPASACVGDGRCAEGYAADSRLCSDCADGYFKQFRIDTCTPCPFSGWGWVLVGLTPVVLLIVSLLALVYARFPTMASVYITLTFLQIAALNGDFDVDWPRTMPFVFTVFSAFNLNQDLFGFQCEVSFTGRYIINLLLPVFLTVLYLVLYAVARCLAPMRMFYVPRQLPGKLWEHFLHSWLMLALLCFVFLTVNFLAAVDCSSGELGEKWLDQNPDIRCGSGEWVSLLVPGVLAFVAYVVVPVSISFSYLYRLRKIDPADRDVVRHGFLFARFRDKFYYWEAVNMAFKFACVLLCKLASSTPTATVATCAALSLLMAGLHAWRRPYRSHMDNNYAIFTYTALAYLFATVIVFDSASFGAQAADVVTALAVCVIVAVVLGGIAVTTVETRILARLRDPSGDSRWHTARKLERRRARRRRAKSRASSVAPGPTAEEGGTTEMENIAPKA